MGVGCKKHFNVARKDVECLFMKLCFTKRRKTIR